MSIQMAFLHQALFAKGENGQTPANCQGRRWTGAAKSCLEPEKKPEGGELNI